MTELVQQVTGRELEPGLRVLVLELSCEGEDDETAFPPLHYELRPVTCDGVATMGSHRVTTWP